MKFTLKVDGTEYLVETIHTSKLKYKVFDGKSEYEMALDAEGDWICPSHRPGNCPLPLSKLGEAIQEHFAG